ncbi:hypothetical protein [Microbulbifer sp. JMSA003]|uniref:hypothetical protein n=1 Tax=Microbulbifer sp. JMSA003 TaxID=3243369 RepID=UPI004039BE59
MKIIYIAFGIIAIFLLGSWGVYQNNKTLFLPYVDMEGVHVSGFYTDVKVKQENKPLDEALIEYPNLNKVLKSIVNSTEGTVERQYLDAFQGLLGERKLILSSSMGSRASFVIASKDGGSSTCLIINIEVKNDFVELVFPPESTIHDVMAIFSAQCNQRQDLAISQIEYSDYLFYGLFRCFGTCENKNGISYFDEVDDFSDIELLVKKELIEQEKKYQKLKRTVEEVKLSGWKIYGSKSDLIVSFLYENPILGEISSSARFEKVENEKYKLLSLAKPDNLTSFFVDE